MSITFMVDANSLSNTITSHCGNAPDGDAMTPGYGRLGESWGTSSSTVTIYKADTQDGYFVGSKTGSSQYWFDPFWQHGGAVNVYLDLTTASSNLAITSVKVCRMTVAGASQGIWASWSGSVSCGTTGNKNFSLTTTGNATTGAITDWPLIVVTFANSGHGDETITIRGQSGVSFSSPNIQGCLDQLNFRARNDDGSETAATWKETLNTNWSQNVDENFRVRFTLHNQGQEGRFWNPNAGNFACVLQYRVNAGTWTDVGAQGTTAEGVVFAASSYITSYAPTTQQISSGSFQRGVISENSGYVGPDIPYISYLAADNYSETELCLKLIGSNVSNGDTIQLRIIAYPGYGSPYALGSYTSTPSITAAGATTYDGTATFTGGTSLTLSPNVNWAGSATFNGSNTLALNPYTIRTASAAFSGSGTFSATGEVLTIYPGTASFNGAGTLDANGSVVRAGAASFDGSGAFSALGSQIYAGAASFDGAGTLVASGARIVQGTAAFTGGSVFSALGEQLTVYFGTASFDGAGTMSAQGSTVRAGAASFQGGATFTGDGSVTYAATASFNGGAIFEGIGQHLGVIPGTASFVGGSVFSATGSVIWSATASFQGAGTFSGVGGVVYQATASFTGGSTFIGLGEIGASVYYGTASFLGAGSIVVNPATIYGSNAAFLGGASFEALGHTLYSALGTFSGGSAFFADGSTYYAASATFNGGSAFSAIGAAGALTQGEYESSRTIKAIFSMTAKIDSVFNADLKM